MSLRTSLNNVLRGPAGYVSRELNRMAPRERRLLAIFGSLVVIALVAAVSILTVSSLASIEDANEASREALQAISRHKDEFLRAKSRMQTQESRIGSEPPQLAADLEAAAREAGIGGIPETRPLPSVPAGKRYLEHSVDVTFRQVELLALSKFLSRLETGRHLIVVSRLSVKRAFTEGQQKLNVSLTATTWERVAEARKKPVATKERS
jgi:hypothetical protein